MNIKKTLVVTLFAIIGISVSAQDRTVTGKVTDEKNGAPLVAASVAVKGTNKGTTTAADGTFSINVASNQTTLVVTLLNYATKEVQIAGKNNISVSLSQSTDQLSDVVVIGYGSVRKKDLTLPHS